MWKLTNVFRLKSQDLKETSGELLTALKCKITKPEFMKKKYPNKVSTKKIKLRKSKIFHTYTYKNVGILSLPYEMIIKSILIKSSRVYFDDLFARKINYHLL